MPFQLQHLKEHNSELLDLLTQHLPDMLWVKDTQGVYLYANKAICSGLLMAKDTQEPIGKTDIFFANRERNSHKEVSDWHTFGELCFNSDKVVIDENKAMRFEEYGNVKGKLLYLEVFKAPFYNKDGDIIGTVGAGRDITDLKNIQLKLEQNLKTLKEQRKLLTYQANYDQLTDLPNRTLFLKKLEESIRYGKQQQKSFAVLFIDLDNFKEINDLLGHTIGDKVLLETAKRMNSLTMGNHTLARLSGDEFCILINNIDNDSMLEDNIKSYVHIMTEPFDIDNNLLHVNMSIGVAQYPKDSDNIHSLLQHADIAMYQAKKDGKNRYVLYNEEMSKSRYEKIMIETELRKAFTDNQIQVYYQPQINAKTNKLVGMEALVRWYHPNMGLIYPDRFIKIIEQNGMVVTLDRIVMQKAIIQFYQWRKNGFDPVKISINLSIRQIESEDFLDFLETFMRSNNFDYNDIEFELTERQIMKHPERSIQTLNKMSDLGISIAVDDFGTGYSSLAYLKRLPICKLKIDKSFIDGLPEDLEDKAISKTIIDLCKNLKMDVIAEGVETDAQKAFLLQHECEVIQGYLYSHPLTVSEMSDFLKKTSS